MNVLLPRFTRIADQRGHGRRGKNAILALDEHDALAGRLPTQIGPELKSVDQYSLFQELLSLVREFNVAGGSRKQLVRFLVNLFKLRLLQVALALPNTPQ